MKTTTLTNAKALVVGANGGIGRAIAIALAGAAVDTALIGRNEAAINAVAASCREAGAAAHPVVCDIARTDTIEAAVYEAIDKLGGLNFLVNCAGISARAKLHETDLGHFITIARV